MVVFSPFSVILVQFRGNPVPVCNDSLLAIVADDQRRYTTKIRQSIVVYSDPLWFLGGEHSFCVNVLGIRKNSYEDNDLQNLTGERIYHLKGLAGKVHLHLLTNDGVEMQCFLVFLTPLGVVLTELPIRVKLQSTIPAFLGVPVPENHKGHVLSRRHVLFDRLIIRHLIAEISTGNRRVLPIDRLCDTVVGDSLRERIAKALAFLECTQEVIDTRGAGVERLGYCHATHTQSVVFCNDVFIV